jgi:ATP-dependent RNA helicase DDX27
MPGSFEIYLHRVGRTARAGKTGRAITIVTEGDRKMVRQAIKASQPTSKGKNKEIKSAEAEDADTYSMRSMSNDEIKSITAKIQSLQSEVEAVLQEEKFEKTMRQTEVELEKGENMLKYKDEILARPKRTWFQSEKEKEQARIEGVKVWNNKMDVNDRNGAPDHAQAAISARKDMVKKEGKKILSHRERRRKEALDDLRVKPSRDEGEDWKSKGKGKGGKGRAAPTPAPAGKLPKFDSAVRNAKKAQRSGAESSLSMDSTSKKQDKREKSAMIEARTGGSSKSKTGDGKKRSSLNQKGKKGGKR